MRILLASVYQSDSQNDPHKLVVRVLLTRRFEKYQQHCLNYLFRS